MAEAAMSAGRDSDAPPHRASAEPVELGALFDAHAPFLVRMVARWVGSIDRAEDVVQRVFLTAHRRGLPAGDVDRARAWLYRVAMNEVRHERRSAARRRRLATALESETPPPPPLPSAPVEENEQAEAVRATVARLPDAQREVFVLYELEELPGADVAKMLGIPENTMWSRLRLARQRFEKLWAEREEER